jgi:CheY-like chemotaxis protein
MSGDRELCIDADMNDYVCKPVRQSELKQALDSLDVRRPGNAGSNERVA